MSRGGGVWDEMTAYGRRILNIPGNTRDQKL